MTSNASANNIQELMLAEPAPTPQISAQDVAKNPKAIASTFYPPPQPKVAHTLGPKDDRSHMRVTQPAKR